MQEGGTKASLGRIIQPVSPGFLLLGFVVQNKNELLDFRFLERSCFGQT